MHFRPRAEIRFLHFTQSGELSLRSKVGWVRRLALGELQTVISPHDRSLYDALCYSGNVS